MWKLEVTLRIFFIPFIFIKETIEVLYFIIYLFKVFKGQEGEK